MTRSRKRSLFSVAVLALTAVAAAAQSPVEPLTIEVVQLPEPKAQDKGAPKKDEPKKKTEAPKTLPTLPDVPPVTQPAGPQAPTAPVAAASTAIAVSTQPPVYGDWFMAQRYNPYLVARSPGGAVTQVRPGQTVLLPVGTTFDRPVNSRVVQVVTGSRTVISPITERPVVVPVIEDRLSVTGPPAISDIGGIPVNVVRGSLKIAENESPRPVDRFFVTYNFFYDVNPTLSVPELPITNVHRETVGFEKTFLDGNASIGIRQPLLQVSGSRNIEAQSLGDLTMVFKYAFINNTTLNADSTQSPGDLLSGGLTVTAPTGNTGAYSSDVPIIHSTILQPFLGAIVVRGDAYVQGFSSIAIPTDSRDTTYIFNSLQFGYQLYRAPDTARLLTSVTPVLEVHVNTPLNNRGLTRLPIGAIDVVNFTGGVTLGLGSRSYLNLGTNAPTSGPQPYVVEAIAQLNIRY